MPLLFSLKFLTAVFSFLLFEVSVYFSSIFALPSSYLISPNSSFFFSNSSSSFLFCSANFSSNSFCFLLASSYFFVSAILVSDLFIFSVSFFISFLFSFCFFSQPSGFSLFNLNCSSVNFFLSAIKSLLANLSFFACLAFSTYLIPKNSYLSSSAKAAAFVSKPKPLLAA